MEKKFNLNTQQMPLIPSTCRYNRQLQISVDNFVFPERDLQLEQDIEDLKIKIPSKTLQYYNADILDTSSTICSK